MKRFKVLNFGFLYFVLRNLRVFCFYRHMNGFSVRRENGDIYLDFEISSHMAACYVVLHDVLGFPVYMNGSLGLRLVDFDYHLEIPGSDSSIPWEKYI